MNICGRGESPAIRFQQMRIIRLICGIMYLYISILHMFSCRLYGLSKYKNQINEDEEIAKELQNGNKPNKGTDSKNK